MKCELCEFEISETEMGEKAIRLDTSEPPAEPTGIVLGIWDQRQKRSVQICGACLVERLMGPHEPTPTEMVDRWRQPQPEIGAPTVRLKTEAAPAPMQPEETPQPKFREFT